jgi:hypothetical protein
MFVTLLFTASVDTGATASTQPRPGHRYIDRRQPGSTAVEICAGIHLLAFPELGYPVSEESRAPASPPCTYRLNARTFPRRFHMPAPRKGLHCESGCGAGSSPGPGARCQSHVISRPARRLTWPRDLTHGHGPDEPDRGPGPTTARRSAVLMLGGLPAPTILEWF